MNIIDAKYGKSENESINVYDLLKEKLIKDGVLKIDMDTNFNALFTDPYPGNHKYLILYKDDGKCHFIHENLYHSFYCKS